MLAVACSSVVSTPEIARAVVLTPADLPSDWSAAAHDTSHDDYTQQAAIFRSCVAAVADAVAPRDVVAHSPDFTADGGTLRAKSWLAVTDADAARAAVASFTDARAPRCMDELVRSIWASSTPASVHLVDVHTDRLPVPPVAAKAAALRSTTTVDVNGHRLVVFVDNVLVARDRYLASLWFVGTTSPLDQQLERRVIDTISARIGKLLNS